MKIEFGESEARALLQLIHLAVKAGGLEVAEAGVVLSKKIQTAMTAPAEVTPESGPRLVDKDVA